MNIQHLMIRDKPCSEVILSTHELCILKQVRIYFTHKKSFTLYTSLNHA